MKVKGLILNFATIDDNITFKYQIEVEYNFHSVVQLKKIH